jgi:hypothetical protein
MEPNPSQTRLDPTKFKDPRRTAKGEPRASVALGALRTVWFNTGTLCNIDCRHCYIESSPTNDRLAYLTLADMTPFLDEIERRRLPVSEIGFTGGEPFMNSAMVELIEAALARAHDVLVLTNAMRPMRRPRVQEALLRVLRLYGSKLTLRVSIDHPDEARHDAERGEGAWRETLDGLEWLGARGFTIAVAGRRLWGDSEADLRRGFAALFARRGLAIDAADPRQLVIFPEMNASLDVPEITPACWDLLGVDPRNVMCASSRMVVKRKGADKPAVVACTLLPYIPGFELGTTLEEASGPVALNHPHCATFCVLGGASCSRSATLSATA